MRHGAVSFGPCHVHLFQMEPAGGTLPALNTRFMTFILPFPAYRVCWSVGQQPRRLRNAAFYLQPSLFNTGRSCVRVSSSRALTPGPG